MKKLDEASAAIRTAQGAIADLVSAAAREQCWDEVTKLSEVGQRLRGLEEDLAAARPVRVPQGGTDPLPGRSVNGTAIGKAKGVYPQFCRAGDVLVKLAWSKSRRSEYEHKSPRKVLTALIAAMLKVGSKGKRFAMEQLLPLADPENPGINLPDYQPYVCMAWLRQEGLIKQYGRSGYSIAKTDSLLEAAAKCWDRLELR